ncbi:ParA family protein [Verrucomicrobiota bacterium]
MNILLCNGKGGTGKTTMAVLLAHALAEAGRRVAVLDLDPQATARNWLREMHGSKVAKHDPGA